MVEQKRDEKEKNEKQGFPYQRSLYRYYLTYKQDSYIHLVRGCLKPD